MLTPDSGSSPYLTVSDLLAFHDARSVGDLALDDDVTAQPTAADLATNAYVLEALAAASGDIEEALGRSGRYPSDALQSLQGNSLASLRRAAAAIAFHILRSRRGAAVEPLPDYERALKFLDDLASGKAVLAFAEAQAAGLPEVAQMTRRDREALGLPSTLTRIFGHRDRRCDR